MIAQGLSDNQAQSGDFTKESPSSLDYSRSSLSYINDELLLQVYEYEKNISLLS